MSSNITKLQAGKKVTIVNVAVNALLTVLKTTLGLLSQSSVLIADGIHSLTDLLSDIFAYFMLKVSHADPDDDHPYGHGKFETIGTFILAALLAFIALGIAWQAASKIISATPLTELGTFALYAALFSILANEFLFRYGKYMGEKVNSSILIANAWHHRSDSLSSLAAVVGIGLSLAGFYIADALAALLVTILLFKAAYSIGRHAFDELVDAAVDDATQKRILATIKNVEGVLGCHFMRARLLGGRIFVDVHVDVPSHISASEGHALAESVMKTLKDQMNDIEDIVVHVDPKNILSIPLPSELQRPRIEETVLKCAEETPSIKSLSKLSFHILKTGIEAHITFEVENWPDHKSTESLKEKIKQHTPFEHIQLSFTLV